MKKCFSQLCLNFFLVFKFKNMMGQATRRFDKEKYLAKYFKS